MLNELGNLNLEPQELEREVEKTIPAFFEEYRNSMVSSAINAEKRAKHWNKEKPVLIGCSLLALPKGLNLSKPELFTGANSKLEEGMFAYPKRKCVEMVALENALGMGKAGQAVDDKEWLSQIPEEKGDIGLIMAVVTATDSHNTGEADTIDHDVLYPCKQCQTNYEYLLSKGLISQETIIYNIRTKDGKPVAGKPMTLKELLGRFEGGKEERQLKTIRDLLETRDLKIQEFKKELEQINEQFGKPDMVPIVPAGLVDPYKAQRGYQRERVEAVVEEAGVAVDGILAAVKSAAEEGVDKTRIVDSLGFEDIFLDLKVRGFTEGELERISKKYQKLFAKILRE